MIQGNRNISLVDIDILKNYFFSTRINGTRIENYFNIINKKLKFPAFPITRIDRLLVPLGEVSLAPHLT